MTARFRLPAFLKNLPDSGSLNGIPQRTVSIFGADGTTLLNLRQFTNVTDDILKTPRSVRWSFHLDQGITKDLIIRLGYLERTAKNDLLIEPFYTSANTGIYLLSSSGRSKYREFQVLGNYFSEKYGNF